MHSILIAVVMTATTITTPNTDKPVKYFELAKQAIFNCPDKNFLQIKPTVVFDLIEVERKYNVPDSLRGILLTMNCLKKQVLFKNIGKTDHRKTDYFLKKNQKQLYKKKKTEDKRFFTDFEINNMIC